MSEKWVQVSEEVARAHKLYGVWGWLLLVVVGSVFGALLALSETANFAETVGYELGAFLSLDHPTVDFYRVFLFLALGYALTVVVMALAKARNFRIVTFWMMVAPLPCMWALAAVNGGVNLGEFIMRTWLVWLLNCAIWGTYLHRSRRVRVTFEHMVRSSELNASDMSQEVSAPQPVERLVPEQPTPPLKPKQQTISSRPVLFSTQNSTPEQQDSVNEASWAQALQEFEGKERRPGLWARVFSEANGDETQAKVLYLRTRVRELGEQRRQRELEEARLRHEREQAEAARLAELEAQKRAYDALEKGTCPNPSCWSVIPLNSTACPNCGALFDEGAQFWKPKPLKNSRRD